MMVKICLVIPSLQAGGMERVMAELCKYFAVRDNTKVHLVLYGKTRQIFFEVPDQIKIHKPSFRFDENKRFISTIRTILFIRKIIKNIQPESILSFGAYWNNLVILSLLGLKYPVYISDRSQPDKSLGRVHDLLRKWLYPKTRGIIAQTTKAKEIYDSIYKHNNIRVIGNPIRPITNGRNSHSRENIVLSVGRLIKSKHHDELIRIFGNVGRKDWKLVIVGYDHLKQKNEQRLKALVKKMNLERQVVFAGKQENVNRYYLSSRIFAFTSSSEGFPNVIGEAMSSGLPVVSFDCVAGPSDIIIDGENGYLVPLFDSDIFCRKLSLLMEDECLRDRMGANARESVKKLSPDIIGEKYYRFILNRK